MGIYQEVRALAERVEKLEAKQSKTAARPKPKTQSKTTSKSGGKK